jgi:hypothetical protein
MAGSKRRTAAAGPDSTQAAPEPKKRRPRLMQEDVPSYSLEQALRVPRAIAENYAYKPTRPLHVAGAMKMSPTAGPFRAITGAAVAYGLTTGAAQAPEIGITPLGMRIVRPTAEGDDNAAKREALLRPRIIGEFLRNYDNAALPTDAIAKNVLQLNGVPMERLDDALQLIIDGAQYVGFIQEYGGKRYVDLANPNPLATEESGNLDAESHIAPLATPRSADIPVSTSPSTAVSVTPGIHINVEIHIAADASSETIEEIFRNMRRYVLNSDGQAESGTASAE